MTKFKLAIFDLAGTTVRDTNTVGSCLQTALSESGIVVSLNDVNAVMGIRKPVAIQMLLDQHKSEGNVEGIHDRFLELMIETYRTSEEVAEIEGTSETFKQLKERGIRVAVDTGFDRKTTEVLLSRMNWNGLLDDSITSDEVTKGRPYPYMIQELCRRARVTPNETIKVGDTPADLQEGKAAAVGLNIGVVYGTHTKEQLIQHEPDALLSDIRELLLLEI